MPSDTRKMVEKSLWLVGVAAFSGSIFLGVQAAWLQRSARAAAASSQVAPSRDGQPDRSYQADRFPELERGARSSRKPTVMAGSTFAHLEIPGIALSVAVLPDFDTASLLQGVGHIPGTAQPGGLGTAGIAGHRDTFFRPLRKISSGMEIRLADSTGSYRYRVDTIQIVTPDRVDVLSIVDRPELVLITCYPFDFIGAAPKRFIVHAHLDSAAPERSGRP